MTLLVKWESILNVRCELNKVDDSSCYVVEERYLTPCTREFDLFSSDHYLSALLDFSNVPFMFYCATDENNDTEIHYLLSMSHQKIILLWRSMRKSKNTSENKGLLEIEIQQYTRSKMLFHNQQTSELYARPIKGWLKHKKPWKKTDTNSIIIIKLVQTKWNKRAF